MFTSKCIMTSSKTIFTLLIGLVIGGGGIAATLTWHGRSLDNEYTRGSERAFVLDAQRRRQGLSPAEQAELDALNKRLATLRERGHGD